MRRVEERRGAYRVLVGKSEGDNLENAGVEVTIILKWMFKDYDGMHEMYCCGQI
jgi:hypothetical protein